MAPTIREGRNRASAEEGASFVSEIDRIEQRREVRLAELDAEYRKQKRAAIKEFDDEQKPIYEDAKKQGVAKGTIRAIVNGQARIRRKEEQLENAKEKALEGVSQLEHEARDQAQDIIRSLGNDFSGFGLGAAAVNKAREDDDKPDEGETAAQAAARAWDEADPANQTTKKGGKKPALN